MATELSNTSWNQLICATGQIVSEVSSSRRSWLSRGRIIIRWSPKVTGLAYR